MLDIKNYNGKFFYVGDLSEQLDANTTRVMQAGYAGRPGITPNTSYVIFGDTGSHSFMFIEDKIEQGMTITITEADLEPNY